MFGDITVGGVVTGVIGTMVCWITTTGFKAYRLWNIKDDIATLQFERKHLEEIKRSSVAMNRSAFKGLFFILACISLGHFSTIWAELLAVPNGWKEGIISSFYVIAVCSSLNYFKRYSRLSEYEKAIAVIDGKLRKLEEKQKKF